MMQLTMLLLLPQPRVRKEERLVVREWRPIRRVFSILFLVIKLIHVISRKECDNCKN